MGFETSGFWAETSLVCDGEDRSWFNGYSGGETVRFGWMPLLLVNVG